MAQLPKIFVISLKRAASRRAAISDSFEKLNIAFEFFDAVDGNELTLKQLERVDLETTKKDLGQYLAKGEVGCALSHLEIYEKCLAERIDEVIILEDDIIIPDCFAKVVANFNQKKKTDCELAFLYHGKCKSSLFYRSLSHGYKLKKLRVPSANSKRFVTGTVGYWINTSGMEKLVKLGYPVRMPADYLTGFAQRNKVNTYLIEPNLLSLTDVESTISRDDDSRKY